MTRPSASSCLTLLAFVLACAASPASFAQETLRPRGPVTDVLRIADAPRSEGLASDDHSGARACFLEVSAAGIHRVQRGRRVRWSTPSFRASKIEALAAFYVVVGGVPSKRGVMTVHDGKGGIVARAQYGEDSFLSLAVADDGEEFAVGNADGFVWRMRFAENKLTRIEERKVHAGPVHALDYAASGRALASAGRDGLVIVRDLRRGTQLVLDDHRAPVLGLAFSPQGREIASCGKDGVLRVHARSGKLMRSWGRRQFGAPLRAVRWRGEASLVVALGDGRIGICARHGEAVELVGEPQSALFSIRIDAGLARENGRCGAYCGAWGGVRLFEFSLR